MGSNFYALLAVMNWTSFLPQLRILQLGQFLVTSSQGRSPLNLMFRTSAFDSNTQMDKPLTSEELELIRRLYANEVPDANYNPYEPTMEWFTGKGKEEIMPISGALQPKRRWVPSKWEKQKVAQQINALRMSFTALSGLENCSGNSARSHTPFETKKYLKVNTLCNLV